MKHAGNIFSILPDAIKVIYQQNITGKSQFSDCVIVTVWITSLWDKGSRSSHIVSLWLLSLSNFCVETKPIYGSGWSRSVRIFPWTRTYTIISSAAWHNVAAEDLKTKTNVAAKIVWAASGSSWESTMGGPPLAMQQIRNRGAERLNCHWQNCDFHPIGGSGWDSGGLGIHKAHKESVWCWAGTLTWTWNQSTQS